ncbi:MAG: PP2C family protein-serine/threonine phosphatase [Muribaculaceae bacterium]
MTAITTKYPFVGCIDTRQGGRKDNQDNAGFVDTPLGLLVVVCDGMGGGPGGRTASLMAVDTILSVVAEVSEHTHRKDALRFAISKANDIIYSKAMETPELRGMGTTAAAIIVNEDSAVIAHVGDTRVYQLHKGTIAFRSADHSVVAGLVRKGQITEEEARNHPQSNVITRALGIRSAVEVEFDEVPFCRGDRFVICSDGIWGAMPQPDLVKALSRIMGINELTALMADEVDAIGREKGGNHDNLTLAVVDSSFDSTRKKIKTDDLKEVPSTSTMKRSDELWVKLKKGGIWFLGFAIAIVFGLSLLKMSNKEVVTQKRVGSTTTTVNGKIKPRATSDDDTGRYNWTSSPKVKNIEKPKEINLTKGQQEILVKKILNDLDSLKNIKKKKQKGLAETKKFNFVNGIIKPDVKRLGRELNKIDETNKIIKLLDDKKTIQCSKQGETTKEALNHIDSIKEEIKKLNITNS